MVVNGSLVLALPPGAQASVAYYTDASGNISAPVPLATASDLQAMEARLQAMEARLQAQIGNVATSIASQSEALNVSLTANIVSSTLFLSSSISAINRTLSQSNTALSAAVEASGQTINARITGVTANLTASITALDSSLNQRVSSVNTQLLNLIDNKVDLQALSAIDGEIISVVTGMLAVNQTNPLYVQLNAKVDQRQLSVIDGEIVAVVGQMVAGNASYATNPVKTALDSKLTYSATCQCVDPRALGALNATVIAEASAINKTLSCHSQGYVYSQTSDSCIYASDFPDCGAAIPNISPYASVGGCSGAKGTHAYGATCTVSCNQGYTVASAVYACNSNTTWTGAPIVCAPLACSSSLAAPANGAALSGTTGFTGAVLTFACNAGYVLNGAATSTCQSSGSWTALPPICLRT